MSAPNDKRTVTTDALETLGTIHEREEKRDAIHLAVEPVTAYETLQPGMHISVKDGQAWRAPPGMGLGIVDPFLPGPVEKGQRFWFVMYPRMVHSLRHVWTHPAFPDEVGTPAAATDTTDEVKSAEAWLRAHAEHIGVAYRSLLEHAEAWVESQGDDYWMGGGEHEYARSEFDAEGFWPRYELVTGKAAPTELRDNFFTCSC